jgi:hypothetical protein
MPLSGCCRWQWERWAAGWRLSRTGSLAGVASRHPASLPREHNYSISSSMGVSMEPGRHRNNAAHPEQAGKGLGHRFVNRNEAPSPCLARGCRVCCSGHIRKSMAHCWESQLMVSQLHLHSNRIYCSHSYSAPTETRRAQFATSAFSLKPSGYLTLTTLPKLTDQNTVKVPKVCLGSAAVAT